LEVVVRVAIVYSTVGSLTVAWIGSFAAGVVDVPLFVGVLGVGEPLLAFGFVVPPVEPLPLEPPPPVVGVVQFGGVPV
jgi:hypothetical protein